ncbi:hypothetical protein VP01_651g4 [Puccinia sorghi]|uniref:Xrn1 helical domain-containing protein n=1 Tax=Puccinia sorghi TaxID=27349 RepID=A0A0L6UGC0_9BASI|nr:hypothetical protein VP01_651g4 [Puccinia sorghi]
MIGLESPIFDLYPLRDSKMDLNGKNFNWEAILKITFTYQERILEYMKGEIGKLNPSIWEHKFLDEEHRRNEFLLTQIFQLNLQISFILPAMKSLWLIKGLCKGFLLGKDFIYGFPTLHNLPAQEPYGGGCGKFAGRLLILCGIPLPLGIQSNSHLGNYCQVQSGPTLLVLLVNTS